MTFSSVDSDLAAINQRAALAYLNERTGKYRFIRYATVADELFAHGMNDTHLLVDLGAGMCDFDFYLRTVRGWKGRYLPVDLSIDENGWTPTVPADYTVAMELIEHLNHSATLLNDMIENTKELVVLTTAWLSGRR